MEKGTFPYSFYDASITLMPISKPKASQENYRPIEVFPTFCWLSLCHFDFAKDLISAYFFQLKKKTQRI